MPARDGQAAHVEEVVHGLVLDQTRAVGQVHPEIPKRLPVPHADELAGADLRARVGAADGQLSDALVEQRPDLSGDDQPARRSCAAGSRSSSVTCAQTRIDKP